MHWIVGLGNPGGRYVGTRHNIGFETVDLIARTRQLSFQPGRGSYLTARGTQSEVPYLLVKPTTFMNECGLAIAEVLEHFDLPLDKLLVVCDDFQLPLGRLRLRARGSDGGHNGLYSIIYHLQTEQFARLRCGIASESTPADKSLMARFVLETFTPAERGEAERMIERAAEAALTVVTEGLAKAMNVFNTQLSTQNGEL